MKSLLTAATALLVSLSASADLNGDGYYRVQNYKSGRYIYVLDDKGSLNFQATTADLGALEVWEGYERTVSDPATVIYVTDVTGEGKYFDFQSQGTGVMHMIDRSVRVLKDKKGNYYRVYGEDSGLARYIGDGTEYESESGYVSSVQPYSSDYVKWYFHPITLDDSMYFGVKPSVEAGGRRFEPFYAAFPFSAASEGIKVWYVSRVDNEAGIAIITEYTGTVAPAMPVLIECASASASGNKLNLGGSATAPADNMLQGVYFKNESISHRNLTAYNSETMRLLGTTADGKLAFVTADIKSLPRNQAYLTVSPGSPAEFRVMTEDEYKAGVTGIGDSRISVRANGTDLFVDGLVPGTQVDVFNITGTLVCSGTGSHLQLPAEGLYIVRVGSRAYKLLAK